MRAMMRDGCRIESGGSFGTLSCAPPSWEKEERHEVAGGRVESRKDVAARLSALP